MLIMDNKEILNKQFEHLNISIYGTYENPLFKAKDIGDLLEIKKITKTIENMDDECKIKINSPTGGVGTNNSDTWFLTEDGVYEVLFISKKPIAKKFKKWVRTLIKDIRQNSNKELQEQLQQQQKLLEYYKEKVYEPIVLDQTVYVMSTDKDNVYKIGETGSNAKKRKNQMQTNCVEDIDILFEFKTCNSKVLENIVHNILEKYRYSGREHFLCNLDYIKMIISIVGKVFNTCKSTSQNISHKEIIEKIEMNVQIKENSISKIKLNKKKHKNKYVPDLLQEDFDDLTITLFPEHVTDDFIIRECETRKILIEELN
jgi:prophage antirepressor-like protein